MVDNYTTEWEQHERRPPLVLVDSYGSWPRAVATASLVLSSFRDAWKRQFRPVDEDGGRVLTPPGRLVQEQVDVISSLTGTTALPICIVARFVCRAYCTISHSTGRSA
jgi:hypothetical protein